uniref:Uncharacterized protein n=1 Tax=Timema douglasi TaxID=61478 RepID=A0A7R8VXK7_TIMDO|nr:unnamed protein product [Timema douglasi]
MSCDGVTAITAPTSSNSLQLAPTSSNPNGSSTAGGGDPAAVQDGRARSGSRIVAQRSNQQVDPSVDPLGDKVISFLLKSEIGVSRFLVVNSPISALELELELQWQFYRTMTERYVPISAGQWSAKEFLRCAPDVKFVLKCDVCDCPQDGVPGACKNVTCPISNTFRFVKMYKKGDIERVAGLLLRGEDQRKRVLQVVSSQIDSVTSSLQSDRQCYK